MVIQPLLTIDDAADYLNVSDRWVRDAVRAGRIRSTRVGKHTRFRKEWLDEFLTASERPVIVAAVPNRRGRRAML
jgi:excisionase family DNA binding protein